MTYVYVYQHDCGIKSACACVYVLIFMGNHAPNLILRQFYELYKCETMT